jgi:hypothetical protein
MARTKPLILLALACGTLTATSSAQERMRAGMWENAVTSNGQTITRSQCVTAADAEGANGSVSPTTTTKAGVAKITLNKGRRTGDCPN